MPETTEEVNEPTADEMGYCTICDVDIYLPDCRDFRCPDHYLTEADQ